jgi:hypothetical protein
MKKKKKTIKRKQKIDIVLESLLNLEQKVKELIDKVDQLYTQRYYHPQDAEPKKYWPNTEPPFKYKDIMWNCEQKNKPFFVKHDYD